MDQNLKISITENGSPTTLFKHIIDSLKADNYIKH